MIVGPNTVNRPEPASGQVGYGREVTGGHLATVISVADSVDSLTAVQGANGIRRWLDHRIDQVDSRQSAKANGRSFTFDAAGTITTAQWLSDLGTQWNDIRLKMYHAKNVTIDGQGLVINITPVYRSNADANVITLVAGAGYSSTLMDGLSFINCENILVKNLTIIGGYTTLAVDKCKNMYFQNCVFLGGADGCADVENSDLVTFDHCIIGDPTQKGYHLAAGQSPPKGATPDADWYLGHGYPQLVGIDWDNNPNFGVDGRYTSRSYIGSGNMRITYYRCLFPHGIDRNPRLAAIGTSGDPAGDTNPLYEAELDATMQNCIVYNWYNGVRVAAGGGTVPGGKTRANLINNLFVTGPDTGNSGTPAADFVDRYIFDAINLPVPATANSGIYYAGNKVIAYSDPSGMGGPLPFDQRGKPTPCVVETGTSTEYASYASRYSEGDYDHPAALDAELLIRDVLPNVGNGDTDSLRLIADVQNFTGQIGRYGPGFLTPY